MSGTVRNAGATSRLARRNFALYSFDILKINGIANDIGQRLEICTTQRNAVGSFGQGMNG